MNREERRRVSTEAVWNVAVDTTIPYVVSDGETPRPYPARGRNDDHGGRPHVLVLGSVLCYGPSIHQYRRSLSGGILGAVLYNP